MGRTQTGQVLLALTLLTACTTGPTRAEHEAQILELQQQLSTANAQTANAERQAEEALARVVDARAALAAAAPKEDLLAQAGVPPVPVGNSALAQFAECETKQEEGRREMYSAMRDKIQQQCMSVGCGISLPDYDLMSIIVSVDADASRARGSAHRRAP